MVTYFFMECKNQELPHLSRAISYALAFMASKILSSATTYAHVRSITR